MALLDDPLAPNMLHDIKLHRFCAEFVNSFQNNSVEQKMKLQIVGHFKSDGKKRHVVINLDIDNLMNYEDSKEYGKCMCGRNHVCPCGKPLVYNVKVKR